VKFNVVQTCPLQILLYIRSHMNTFHIPNW